MGTPTEGTHPPCSAHTKGAHPYGPPETPSPLGTTTHPACVPTAGETVAPRAGDREPDPEFLSDCFPGSPTGCEGASASGVGSGCEGSGDKGIAPPSSSSSLRLARREDSGKGKGSQGEGVKCPSPVLLSPRGPGGVRIRLYYPLPRS